MGHVLIVDDDSSTVNAMATVLRQDGHEVDSFTSGHEAIATLRSGLAFDAVITDLQVPFVDGVAIARAARAYSPNACILVTHRGRADSLQLSQAGACATVEKPIHYDGVLSVIEACHARGGRVGVWCPGCPATSGVEL